jgi:nucleoside-diphosphate-sugar epimerase
MAPPAADARDPRSQNSGLKGDTLHMAKKARRNTLPGQPRRCLDTSRAREAFGFEAAVDFDKGLAQTIQWWRNRP